MSDQRYPYVAMYGHVRGQRRRGRQKKRWMDMIKEDCNEMDVKLYDATQLTQNRAMWRTCVEELLTRANQASPRH